MSDVNPQGRSTKYLAACAVAVCLKIATMLVDHFRPAVAAPTPVDAHQPWRFL